MGCMSAACAWVHDIDLASDNTFVMHYRALFTGRLSSVFDWSDNHYTWGRFGTIPKRCKAKGEGFKKSILSDPPVP